MDTPRAGEGPGLAILAASPTLFMPGTSRSGMCWRLGPGTLRPRKGSLPRRGGGVTPSPSAFMGGAKLDRPEVPPLFCGVSVQVWVVEREAAWDIRGVCWSARWSHCLWHLGREGRLIGPPLTSLSQAVAFSLGLETGVSGTVPTEGA